MGSAHLVDFHCHLDLYPDLSAAIERCEREEVFTLTVTTTPKAWLRNHELTSSTRHVRAALGLHPQLIAERAHEISLWEELLPQSRYVGEVGLDAGPRFYATWERQKEVFARVLTVCAAARNKIITVHSVRSAKVVLDMIEAHMSPAHGRVVLHWFTGSASDARRALDLGCYFSINSEMLANDKRVAVVRGLPLDRLLTETDGPFTKVGDRPSFPTDVESTVAELSRVFEMSLEATRQMVLNNLKALLTETV